MEDFTKIPSQFDDIEEDRPIVFISYSWDSDEHKEWVKKLADALRVKYGINVLLDQYNRGGYNLVDFMKEGIKRADRVLIIGTSKYKVKLEKHIGGTAFEDQLISLEQYKKIGSPKFIPVLREGGYDTSFSSVIEVNNGYDMRDDDGFDQILELLASDIWNNPLNAAPALGPKPVFAKVGENVIVTPAVNTMSTSAFMAEIKRLLSDPHGEISLIDMIETEGKRACEAILSKADYNFHLTEALFDEYLKFHLASVEKLIVSAIVVVRFGTLEQQKLFLRILAQLCMKPFKDGEIIQGDNAYLHLWASQFLFHSIGLACVRYEKYRLLPLMMKTRVPAGNALSVGIGLSLPFLAGRNHWNNLSLNGYLRSNWIYPYSWLIIRSLYPSFKDYVMDNAEFENYYFAWEHLFSLMYEYYDCGLKNLEAYQFPIGQFVNKRASIIMKEVDNYTEFFKEADDEKSNWKPIKDGLFGGSYQNFKTMYDKAEEFYSSGRIG